MKPDIEKSISIYSDYPQNKFTAFFTLEYQTPTNT